jgi:hypothetical protein
MTIEGAAQYNRNFMVDNLVIKRIYSILPAEADGLMVIGETRDPVV